MARSNNVTPIVSQMLNQHDRATRNGHKAGVFWLTGLSGAGKSTIAIAAEQELHRSGVNVFILDGDNMRTGLCGDLGFSIVDRTENIRRIAEVAALFRDAGVVVICSFISPTKEIREKAKAIIGQDYFTEVYVSADLATCENRDVKGLYEKARAGEIKGFTGIDSPYEIPEHPDLTLKSGVEDLNTCTKQLVDYIQRATSLSTGI